MLHAEVNLSNLEHNFAVIKERIPEGFKVIFVAKVDGYGHGLAEVSQVAVRAGVDYLAVTNTGELKSLRDKEIDLPVLIFGPIEGTDEVIHDIVKFRGTPTITNGGRDFLAKLSKESEAQRTETPIQINVDTGMHRTGLMVDEAVPFMRAIEDYDGVQVEGIYSHLSAAESAAPEDERYTYNQIKRFHGVLGELTPEGLLSPLRHIGNSAGFLRYEEEVTEPPLNAVRMGTLFYGYPEVDQKWTEELATVMSLYTKVAEIRRVHAGSYLGYGREFQVSSDRRIAVLPVGYGDGLTKKLSHGGRVRLHGKNAPVVGKLSANHTLVDVTNLDRAAVGDTVELFGPNLSVIHTCQDTGASVLELLYPLASREVERTYVSSDVS